MGAAADEYTRRLQARGAALASAAQLDARLGVARLALAALTLALAAAAIAHLLAPAWLAVPVALFAALVLWHAHVRRDAARARLAMGFYRRGLDRIEDRWAGQGASGDRFEDPQHVYAADLDLFGRGSLFELLCAARTRMGEAALAAWLKSPAPLAEIRARQTAIAELGPRLEFREALACGAEERAEGLLRPEALLSWCTSGRALPPGLSVWLPRALALAAVGSAALWGVTGIKSPFFALLLLEAAIAVALRERIDSVLKGAEEPLADLPVLVKLLSLIEQEPFSAPWLTERAGRLRESERASQCLDRLATIAAFAEARENPIVRLLDVPLMYSLQIALAGEAWRAAHGQRSSGVIEVVGECEALASLAAFAYEHPEDAFPELLTGRAQLEARGLGHPLIPAERCVRNDVALSGATRVLVVSGSNMSGKSTLLRAVGVNVALAMAGAPVRAHSLALTPLQIGASIRLHDSLQEGVSRFYVEVTRLRALMDLTGGERALLFLLDELLQGTNSADRRIGTEAIVRALIERAAIGLLTTHDLALTELHVGSPGALRNVHFQDELEGGRLRFDFRLREGVVTRSNGLALMRSVGLDV